MRVFVILMLMMAMVFPSYAAESPVKKYEAPLQVTLSFTGDCTIGNTGTLRGQDASFEAFVEKNGLSYPFANVKSLFEQDDLTIINLEGVFHDSDKGEDTSKVYRFRSPTSYARMLPESSIEACYMGNNHVMDYGSYGYQSTVQALKENNIAYFGTTEFEDKTYVYQKGNAKIGFVSTYISHWWLEGNGTKMRETIRKLKEEEGCQVVIACIHGGVEYDIRHDNKMDKMGERFLDYGVDIVVGNHPHAIQGMRTKKSGQTILWSLGNFVFGGNKSVRSIRTYVAQFTLSFQEDGSYLGHQLNIFPAHMSGTKDYNNYQPVLITEPREAQKILDAIQLDTKTHKLQPYQPGIGALQNFVPAPVS